MRTKIVGWIRRAQRAALITHLISLQRDIFSCFLEDTYADNIYLYERRIHLQKAKCMRALLQLTRLQTPTEKNSFSPLFDLMLDYAQLRWRVSDHTIFTICHDELAAINQAIITVLQQKQQQMTPPRSLTLQTQPSLQQPMIDTEALAVAIDRFEENYQQVLQVTAREPLAFLLFIYSLKAFSKQIVDT